MGKLTTESSSVCRIALVPPLTSRKAMIQQTSTGSLRTASLRTQYKDTAERYLTISKFVLQLKDFKGDGKAQADVIYYFPFLVCI